MSKSLGNFFTVREISEKYDLQVLRFFMLSAHYRSPLNFSADLMEASKNGLERVLTAVDKLHDGIKAAQAAGRETMTEEEKAYVTSMKELVAKFEEAMDDDFNTADAISAIFELVKLSNTTISENSSNEYLSLMLQTLEKLCDVMGIITEKKEEILDSEIEAVSYTHLVAAVRRLEKIQTERRRRKRRQPVKRGEEERKLLEQAKELLMRRNGMAEPEAHKYLQKCSMDSGTGLLEAAQMVLELYQ